MENNITTTTFGSELTDKLRNYIEHHFLIEFGADINDETDLFVAGILDSFGFIELITFIEKTFEIRLKNEDLLADKLNSIESIMMQVRSQLRDK